MTKVPETVVIRHRRENLKKCSLRGLEQRSDFLFLTYPLRAALPDLSSALLLTLDAPPLERSDAVHTLVLLDATWRYAAVMARVIPLPPNIVRRSLPASLRTAYPRRQECGQGLASIEALYAAYVLMGRDPKGLLDGYHWSAPFL